MSTVKPQIDTFVSYVDVNRNDIVTKTQISRLYSICIKPKSYTEHDRPSRW